ncbi:HNH endonuclease [Nitrospira sp. BLG_1]|uniref:HNH endonuclease n=1 Tax=Nitrospira sp. BLG_1 TaxID=3395883 RepID=UPI0039BCDD19
MEVGDRIGKLVVVSKRWIRKGWRIDAECECGFRISRPLSAILLGKVKTCGRKKCSPRVGPSIGRVGKGGYRYVRVLGKEVFEHRLLVEQNIGRKLLESEVVHHRNGKRDDNRIENLVVMDRAAHSRMHAVQILEIAILRERIKELELGKSGAKP